MDGPPRLYFRARENGAAVFRVETATRDGRLDLRPVAIVNVRNGEVKPQGAPLEPEDAAEVEAWLAARRAEQAMRGLTEARQCIERLGLTAQWAQSRATPDDLDSVTDELLVAMHDLRAVLLRRRAERIEAGRREAGRDAPAASRRRGDDG